VREIILAPKQTADSAGALVLYQIEAVRPMTLTFSFTPNMQRMWPAESDDRPSPEWVNTDGSSGFYMLHLNFPDHAAPSPCPPRSPALWSRTRNAPPRILCSSFCISIQRAMRTQSFQCSLHSATRPQLPPKKLWQINRHIRPLGSFHLRSESEVLRQPACLQHEHRDARCKAQ